MSKTNCCNCGAALNIFAPKCEFCGTKNINMTEIDLASGEAANFIFRMPHNIKVEDQSGKEIYMSILAVPELEAMEITTNPINVYGGWRNAPIMTYNAGSELRMNLNLHAVQKKSDNTLCTLTIK